MKPIYFDYIAVFASILFFILPLCQVIFIKKAKWYKKISFLGWIYITISVTFLILGINGINAHSAESLNERNHADKAINSAATRIINTLKNSKNNPPSPQKLIYFPDSLNNNGIPQVSITGFTATPSKNNDSINGNIAFTNTQNIGVANFTFKYQTICVLRNKSYLFSHVIKFNDSIKIPTGITSTHYFIIAGINSNVDTLYMRIRCRYSNFYNNKSQNDYALMAYVFANKSSGSMNIKTQQRIALICKAFNVFYKL